MKIFLALLLSFGCLLAEQNLTKELINKEMIKQITSPDEIKTWEGYDEFCSELVNDLKTGKNIEVLVPMNKEEIEEARAKVENLPKLPDGRPMNRLHESILGMYKENKDDKMGDRTTLFKLDDDKYLEDFKSLSYYTKEFKYMLSVLSSSSKGDELGLFYDTFTYPHYSIRYNAMHKPIKYKDKYYVIRTWKSFDYKYFWNPSWETDTANKDKILFSMTLFDLHTNRTEACHVAKRIKRIKK